MDALACRRSPQTAQEWSTVVLYATPPAKVASMGIPPAMVAEAEALKKQCANGITIAPSANKQAIYGVDRIFNPVSYSPPGYATLGNLKACAQTPEAGFLSRMAARSDYWRAHNLHPLPADQAAVDKFLPVWNALLIKCPDAARTSRHYRQALEIMPASAGKLTM